ncbi:aldo/keto reductase [Lactobacillus hamsteri]|uniref:2,5-diketo-D-gluconate reductase n=1 Tax=Lactobacillus hamsteri DSM 5661 = JCM 6256 TaxID=1423754 RepID=A0A0R1YGB1_9LACO|nr:aldo/keto reductase [Lactobacillus hamsteri]KRM38131.1 2,5-diketo-D-gluconate reductase [Lactobacillus hamsteri DSM 5661 = JCM 6256]
MKYFSLNDGNRIPALGFGTYKLNGSQGVAAIRAALTNGYRLLDSAVNYENEGAVGHAVKQSSISRDNIFITSKLPGRHHSYQEAINQIQESLYSADLDYFDLYLIHWPNPKEDKYVEAWQALIDAQKFGLIRSIGVSNFEPEHIDRLIKETGVTPAVNQVELHPYCSNKQVREYDDQHKIITEAWSPLQRGGEAFKEEIVQQLAKKYAKSPAQIILRWETQMNVVPIPKASSYDHQLSNLDIFDFKLTNDEIQKLVSIDKENGRRFDPNEHEEF